MGFSSVTEIIGYDWPNTVCDNKIGQSEKEACQKSGLYLLEEEQGTVFPKIPLGFKRHHC